MRLPINISTIRGLRSEDNPSGNARICDADGKFICTIESQADAEFIVASANRYAAEIVTGIDELTKNARRDKRD